MASKGQRRGAEIFMEGGGNLHGGGQKSLKRGAEITQKWWGGAHGIGCLIIQLVIIHSNSVVKLYKSTDILLIMTQS